MMYSKRLLPDIEQWSNPRNDTPHMKPGCALGDSHHAGLIGGAATHHAGPMSLGMVGGRTTLGGASDGAGFSRRTAEADAPGRTSLRPGCRV